MIRHRFLVVLFAIVNLGTAAQVKFPAQIYSGLQESLHVQGIAYDAQEECMYMSFTTSLIKVDMQGRLIGSVKGLTGHLGSVAWNPADGRIYGSLEYKHDVISEGILKATGVKNDDATGYYIAIFDGSKITREGMAPNDVMTTVFLPEVLGDVEATVTNNGKEFAHRFGTAGVDGVTFAPRLGKKSGKWMLYVAYGFFSDVTRTDNDHQILLCFDVRNWKKYERQIDPMHLHTSGPAKADGKYFVRTGNTNWGIQNLSYDAHTGYIFAAAYPGRKPDWPNYTLFAIDAAKKPRQQVLQGVEPETKALVASLAQAGQHDEKQDVWGWHCRYGSFGIASLGDGFFYLSQNGRDKDTGREYTYLRRYRWSNEEGMTLDE